MTFEVREGDCVELMRGMPAGSVDAVVCDPPYGLEFMGASWDRLTGVGSWATGSTETGYTDGAKRLERPAFGSGRNPMCRSCRKHKRGTDSCGCASPDFDETPADGNRLMQEWHQVWATEALRVLKPGGHLLAFGGTRTSHRLACAIEDAGFEIRDTICWMYGSGFPKSLDVSKAIDKRRDWTLVERLAGEIRRARLEAGLSLAEVGERTQAATDGRYGSLYYRGGFKFFETGLRLPSRTEWNYIKTVLPIGGEFQTTYDEAEREVLEERTGPRPGDHGGSGHYGHGEDRSLTAPATPEAERWEGWGTALKPSNEPVVVARKPRSERDVLAEIGSWLGTLEAWLAQEVDPTTPTGEEGASPAQTDTSSSGSVVTTFSSTVTSWRRCWVELWTAASTSTTSTESGTTTGLRTLWSSLLEITRESITPARMQADGWRLLVEAVDTLFAAAVLSSRATHALSAHESATGNTLTCSPDEDDGTSHRRPAHEPVVVARKPLSGTVAATVLEHGTGALNVDGCRVAMNPEDRENWEAGRGAWADRDDRAAEGRKVADVYGTYGPTPRVEAPAGRWPANVVLDDEAAGLLDEQTGERIGSRTASPGNESGEPASGVPFVGGRITSTYDDVGGASRFFYCAKSSRGERNAGLEGFEAKMNPVVTERHTRNLTAKDGVQQHLPRANGHPTVKPISLMRWLVRLVTPPGGTVLDPFTGSGSTGCAAVLEGFDFVGLEREPEYVKIAEARIAWWHKHRGDGEAADILAAGEARDEVEATGQLDMFG